MAVKLLNTKNHQSLKLEVYFPTSDGTSDVIGKLKSVEEPRKALYGTPKKECQLRNAM